MKKKKCFMGIIWQNVKRFSMEKAGKISSRYRKIRDYLEKKVNSVDGLEYQHLAPTDNMDEGEEYFAALEWASKEDNILNIALSGPYGSGKSSVIKTYLKGAPSINAINISLATFLDVNKKTGSEQIGEKDEMVKSTDGQAKEAGEQSKESTTIEDVIEAGVLKQLFYRVNHKKIPQSRYHKLHRASGIKTFLIMSFVTLVIYMVLFCLYPDINEKISDNLGQISTVLKINKNESMILVITLQILVIAIFTYGWRWIASKYRLKEINLTDKGSIVANEKSGDSIFDKNIDEIIYFFEETKFDTVFIEDLDRFQSVEIFIRLRELNHILNNAETIKRKIVFVYAVKDDLFEDKERTKFFDFIIPIIPVINGTNSDQVLRKRLVTVEGKDETFKYNISQRYITQVSPYIDDMRVLTNIYNEFVLYKKILGSDQKLKLIDENMMSIIIVKNLFPKMFSDLQMEKGTIKETFEDKQKFIKFKCQKLRGEINEKETVLENIAEDIFSELEELKASMMYYMTSRKGIMRSFSIRGRSHTAEEFMRDDFDMELLIDERISVSYISLAGSNTSCIIENIDDIKGEEGEGKSYVRRWKILKESEPERQNEIKDEIEYLKKEEQSLKSMKMKKILQEYDIKEILQVDAIGNRLLIFLLKNGYIDETYMNYINNFHANSITVGDMNFILSVRNEEAKEFSYPLTKCEQIVDRLLDYDFESKEIYNFDLLEYLLENRSEDNRLNKFAKQLGNGDKDSWQFIDEFIDITKYQGKFINVLVTQNQDKLLWSNIVENPALTDRRKMFYFHLIISNVDIANIKDMNCFMDKESNFEHKGYIYEFIVENTDILKELVDVKPEKVCDLIDALGIDFYDLNCAGVNGRILEHIFRNQHYVLNEKMIEKLFLFKEANIDNLNTQNYTAVRKLGYEPLIEYINGEDYFKSYVQEMILDIDTNTEESLETVLYIINKLIDEPQMCCELIEKENIILDEIGQCAITEIDEKREIVRLIWNKFLGLGKVVMAWRNILTYWKHFAVTNELVEYIEKNLDNLLLEKESIDEEFVKKIIVQRMDMEKYNLFIANFRVADFGNNMSDFSEEQMEAMIIQHYFELTPERLIEMREVYPELCVMFLLENKINFFSNINDYALDIDEQKGILMSQEINDSEKGKVLSSIELENITYDIAYVVRNMQVLVNKDVVEQCWEILNKDDRYELFINQIRQYSLAEIANRMKELGGPYEELADRSKRHKVKLHYTEYNVKLMTNLEQMGYLTSKEIKEKVIEDPVTYDKKTEKQIEGMVKQEKP